jgi:ubiquinone/menaquinone biosynthesis C-methylase UbiE
VQKVSEDAKELRKLWGGFQSARVLLTANNYRVFDFLKSSRSADEMTEVLKTDARATETLLDALVGLGLLRKAKMRYQNSTTANRFLVTGTPYYQGDILRHADILWKNWSGLDAVVRTGKPSHVGRDHDSFIRGMHNIASLKAREVIKAIDMRGIRHALDLGGGPGTYSIEMAKKGVSVTLFDRPETIQIAREIVRKSGQRNVDFLEGDFFSDDVGEGYDLVFVSQVFHSFSEADNRHIINKTKKALGPNGRLVVQEFFINKDRTYPAHSSLFSVNMLVNTAAGRCYSPTEMKQWLSEAGFRRITQEIVEDTVLVGGNERS